MFAVSLSLLPAVLAAQVFSCIEGQLSTQRFQRAQGMADSRPPPRTP